MGRHCCSVLSCLLLLAVFSRQTAVAEAPGPFGPQAVWTLPEKAWAACLQQSRDATGCLRKIMKKSRATPQAREVNRLLDGEGYMGAFREMGRVDLATMVFPLRANTNEAVYLVNGTPLLVSSELDEKALSIEANPDFVALKRVYPEVMFWPASDGLRSMDALPDGGQGFVFTYPLLNGCHACEVIGQAVVSLDFGADGVSRGPRLLRVEPAR